MGVVNDSLESPGRKVSTGSEEKKCRTQYLPHRFFHSPGQSRRACVVGTVTGVHME